MRLRLDYLVSNEQILCSLKNFHLFRLHILNFFLAFIFLRNSYIFLHNYINGMVRRAVFSTGYLSSLILNTFQRGSFQFLLQFIYLSSIVRKAVYALRKYEIQTRLRVLENT